MKLFERKEKAMSPRGSKEILCGLYTGTQASVEEIKRTDKEDIEKLLSMFQAMGSH